MSTSNRSRSTPVNMAALCASDPWKQCTTSDGHLEIIEIKRPKKHDQQLSAYRAHARVVRTSVRAQFAMHSRLITGTPPGASLLPDEDAPICRSNLPTQPRQRCKQTSGRSCFRNARKHMVCIVLPAHAEWIIGAQPSSHDAWTCPSPSRRPRFRQVDHRREARSRIGPLRTGTV